MPTILFLGSHNAARSRMAEAFARARQVPDLDAVGAGLEPGRADAQTVRTMAEIGLILSGEEGPVLEAVAGRSFDIVVTLSREAAEQCPHLPGNPACVDWSLADPRAIEGDEATVAAGYRNVRDQIRRLVADFFERGYYLALLSGKHAADVILENISDGMIAHDEKRRIFYFNKAAERITGYSRAEVLNRDCHDVFPGNLCGGKCRFCEAAPEPDFDVLRQEVSIVTRSGEERRVQMTIQHMQDSRGAKAGILSTFRDVTRERDLARRVGEIHQFSGIIGRDRKMLEIYDLIRELADSSVPVLIQGESGTGKELVAAAIHNEGPRAGKLFVPVNCGALPETLLESELFGHVKGAFTGAIRDKKGRFELADGGTIFLDEIGDISPAMQVKLMRVVQEGTFERVGSEITVKVDVRLISATNKDLSKEIADGRFRDDLYYRLSVVPLFLPPLRERRNDIPLLVEHILGRILRDMGRERVDVAPETLDVLMGYDWPGNVRELQNWLQFALVKCRGKVILPEHLPPLRRAVVGRPAPEGRRRRLDMAAVESALRQTGGNKVEAARLLGVSRATLYRFLDSHASS